MGRSRRFRFAGLRIRRHICMMGVYLLSKTRWNSSIWCWNFSWHNPRKPTWWLFCGCYSEGQAPLLKQGNRKTRTKAYELPGLAVGDVLLIGKFKNRKATITGFSSDENNQPVAQTDKGDQKIFKPRIAKLMPAKQRLMAYCGRADPPVAPLARLLVWGPAGDQSDNT